MYSPEPRGHYALALDEYLHFTSPIRRYPDLVCHRMLRRALGKGEAPAEPAAGELRQLGEHCSAAEQRAESAEREAVQWMTVLFLADRCGEVFDGHISGVAPFGIFVELDEYLVDGMIHVSELEDDFYQHDPVGHRLIGERSRRQWRLGDALEVRLESVDLDAMQVKVAPVDVVPDGKQRKKGRRRQGGR
jgi:ribonuclease R